MSAPKFTPGPWWIGDPNCRLDGIREKGIHADDYVIADMNADAGTEAQLAADARLIAAAPELYEALLSLVYVVEAAHWPRTSEQMVSLNTARAALAKAVQP